MGHKNNAKYFNVRIYGLLINKRNEALVCDEIIHGRKITKFPGGGLEFGEGTIDALKREMMEETGTMVEVMRHFYTTDFFQVSAFNPQAQVISIYYLIKPLHELSVPVALKKFDFTKPGDGAISFRWLSVSRMKKSDFTFPIDRKVAGMLKSEFMNTAQR